jgi:hypothetical protein
MRDFSRSGIYFMTERASFLPGMHLHVVPSFGGLNLEYLGEIVRVDSLPFGEFGIAVRLLRVENLVGDTRTAVMAAFEAFALAEGTVGGSSQNETECSAQAPS